MVYLMYSLASRRRALWVFLLQKNDDDEAIISDVNMDRPSQ